MLTLGALFLLYALYQLWFTNLTSQAQATAVREQIELSFAATSAPDIQTGETEEIATQPSITEVSELAGSGFALAYIPKLKDDVWAMPVLSGIGATELASGLGHYQETELPGETGNFAIAGHRATNGEPFARFENLEEGDLVIIRTQEGWFSYQLFQDQKISETEVWVLQDKPVATSSNQLITLTTCDPRWNSYQRWAWWGELIEVTEPDQVPSAIAGN